MSNLDRCKACVWIVLGLAGTPGIAAGSQADQVESGGRPGSVPKPESVSTAPSTEDVVVSPVLAARGRGEELGKKRPSRHRRGTIKIDSAKQRGGSFPGRSRPGGLSGRRKRVLNEGQIEEGMAFLEKHWPERHAPMKQLAEEDPEGFSLAFGKIWPQLSRMIELNRNNPELAGVEVALVKLESRILRAARAFHQAAKEAGFEPPKDVDGQETLPEALKAPYEELKSLVGLRFDLRIKRSELRFQELAEQLAHQRQRLEKRRYEKDGEVDRALKRLVKGRKGIRRLRGHGGPSQRGSFQNKGRPGRAGAHKSRTPATKPAAR